MATPKRTHLTPAEYVVLSFNGVRNTARAIGRSATSVSNWKNSKHGQIPTAARLKILASARGLGLDITSNDLDFGRKITPKKRAPK